MQFQGQFGSDFARIMAFVSLLIVPAVLFYLLTQRYIVTGLTGGDEVVQLYTHQYTTSVTRPLKELKGFQQVTIEPHQTKTVTFCLKVNQFGFYNQAQIFVVEPGTVEVMVGHSSQDIPCTGEFEILATKTDIQASKVFFSEWHSE